MTFFVQKCPKLYHTSPNFCDIIRSLKYKALCREWHGAFLVFRKGCCRMAEKSKQDVFVEEYLIDLNATQAAIRAGYSVRTAEQQGSRLLSNVKVQTKIAKAMAERSRRTGVNQDRVVLELARLGFVNPAEVIDVETGEVLPTATEDDLACIQSVKVKTTTKGKSVIEEREVRFYNKARALEKLGQHLGMWNDKIDVNVAVPVVICGEDDLEE